MVSALDSGSSGPGSSPGIALCIWVTHFTLGVSLHPGVQMGTCKLYAGANAGMD